MKNYNVRRGLAYTKLGLFSFLRLYKALIITGFLFALFGFMIGIFTAFKFTGDLTIEHINDKTLIYYITGDTGWLGFFLVRLVNVVFMVVCIGFLCMTRFTSLLCYLILIYKTYKIGVTCAVLINIYGVGGIINVLVVIIPCNLIFVLALIGLIIVLQKGCFASCRYKESIFSSFFFNEYGNTLIFISIILIISIILEMLLLPSLTIFIIE